MPSKRIKFDKAFFKRQQESYAVQAKRLLPEPTPEEKERWEMFIDALRQSGVFDAKHIAEVDSWSATSLKKKVSFSFINRYCAYVDVWRAIKLPYFWDEFTFNAITRADYARSKWPHFLMIAI